MVNLSSDTMAKGASSSPHKSGKLQTKYAKNHSSPSKPKKILICTNVLRPEGTPYGWIFANNGFNIKEELKALANNRGDTTHIGGTEFKLFSNLTTQWVTESQIGPCAD